MSEVLMGNYLYLEYVPAVAAPGILIELRVTTQGFLLEGLYARGNRKVRPQRANLVRQKLAACGVALYDRARGDEDAIWATASMLGLYNFSEYDNSGWGVGFGDEADALEELEAALAGHA